MSCECGYGFRFFVEQYLMISSIQVDFAVANRTHHVLHQFIYRWYMMQFSFDHLVCLSVITTHTNFLWILEFGCYYQSTNPIRAFISDWFNYVCGKRFINAVIQLLSKMEWHPPVCLFVPPGVLLYQCTVSVRHHWVCPWNTFGYRLFNKLSVCMPLFCVFQSVDCSVR